MAPAIILNLLVVVLIILYYVNKTNKKRESEQSIKELYRRAKEINENLTKLAINIAHKKNKIGVITYDIEEGGRYLTESYSQDIRTVINIASKYFILTKNTPESIEMQVKKFNLSSSSVLMEDEINCLPDGKKYYSGF